MEVVRPIEADMGMEVVCPPVVTPGEFFLCTADIPQGSDLTFSLVMTDDLQVVELETKVKRRFAKISQSRRRPLLGPMVESAY